MIISTRLHGRMLKLIVSHQPQMVDLVPVPPKQNDFLLTRHAQGATIQYTHAIAACIILTLI